MATETAKKAVQSAYQYLLQISAGTVVLANFRVEEVNLDSAKRFLITLSYDIQGEFAFEKKREYKEFQVSSDGETVLSMKIRKI